MHGDKRHPNAKRSRTKSDLGGPAAERRRAIAVSAGLAIITFATFAGSLSNGFIDTYDDRFYVLKNPNIQDGVTISSITYALTGVCAAHWCQAIMLSHVLGVRLIGSST